MPKVTINDGRGAVTPVVADTPSAEIIKSAVKVVNTTDVQGRTLTVQKITPLRRMRLFALAGPELSKNEQWIGMAVLAASVTAINGDPVSANSIREVEFLVERLDDDGLDAVGAVYVETWGIKAADDAVADAKN
jgi:hypothetical protein